MDDHIRLEKSRSGCKSARPGSGESRWVRVPALEGLRGIKKGTAYNLIHAGLIQSVRLPNAPTNGGQKVAQKKSTKGVRLVFLPSVDAFLERLMEQQTAAAAVEKAGT